MKKKILKIFLIILLVVIVIALIFFINTFRKFLIIKKLQSNFEEYASSTNYYMKQVTTYSDSTDSYTLNYYTKDGKRVALFEQNLNGETGKIECYDNGENISMFVEGSNGKYFYSDTDLIIADMYNGLESESNLETFLACIYTKIEKIEYNEEECYLITDFLTSLSLGGTEINELYIVKDTGICLKSVTDNTIVEKEFEFDNVDDEIFIEPDISDYTIVEQNT